MKSKLKQDCVFDVAVLDEAFLGLDAGDGKIGFARSFRADAGGEGVEIARGLSRCFGLDVTFVSALAENGVGILIKECLLRGGVALSHVKWMRPGKDSSARNAILFSERGFGLRYGSRIRDNHGSASAALRPYDIDWTRLFADQGVRWFHTSGSFAAASKTAGQTALAAARAAKRSGSLVSFRINGDGGQNGISICKDIAREADVIFGQPAEVCACLGIAMPEAQSAVEPVCARIMKVCPSVSLIAFSLCRNKTSNACDWTAAAWNGTEALQGAGFAELDVMNAAGAEEAFMAGFIYGMLLTGDAQNALDYGVAHGALCLAAATAASSADKGEVENLMRRGGADIPGGRAEWPLTEWSSGEW